MQAKKATLVFIVLFFIVHVFSFAQDSFYVKWNPSVQKISDNTYELYLKASVANNWYVYAKSNEIEDINGIQIHFTDSLAVQKQGEIQLNGTIKSINDKVFNKSATVLTNDFEIVQKLKTNSTIAALKLVLSYNVSNTAAVNPEDYKFTPEEQKLSVALQEGTTVSSGNRILIPSIDINKPVSNCGGTETSSNNLWQIFFWGILGGLVSLLTPCVFPMIPLTVSFFTKKSGNKSKGIFNGALYGFFIFLIYVLLSVPFYFIEKNNPEILNNISTNAWLNVFFFLVFVFFAISFFGYYEITLPDKVTNSAGSKAGIGNIIGIFFMALTLAIVSFSCTGPLLGTLVVSSLNQHGGAFQLTAAMAGFGIAFGLPFALFAMFPNLLDKLPKSGGWLNSFKVILGFLELAFAFKFLSNADLVEHWGILKREIFIGIWIIIGICLTLYLLGKIKFPHDSPIKKLTKGRISLAGISGAFTVYLFLGLLKVLPLSLISGFLPPLHSTAYHDYEEGLKVAKAENKPILLDFTGYACVNCRRMEENVWSQSDVHALMQDRFVVISLFVDDKKPLPSDQQFTYKSVGGTEKEIVTYGDKWATFETENFKQNSQPLYAIISNDEKLLTNPVGYTPDVNEYKHWLECGLKATGK
ncbi:protein-disulfide reductase DsbD family protein [Ferruginibacter albus]|uniref:protein-disulfide reductase DsbD family protein n=1 Tax=Ferruginibacter albus TaxID=2875540 RepID=UPI001CC7CB25|nr:thioredoxin family protein [Ferruginibacter albus]UAY52468.1 thioredoxin family protein [Ferruginibacter albus]